MQARNLSFKTSIKEIYTGFELSAIDISKNHFTPYLFLGVSVFHFNPYTYDKNNQKIYLKLLSTEGQGLADYPERKPYKLTQAALAWACGVKYAINDYLIAAVEFKQRKTFTDYLDDVSSSYVDYDKLLAAKGQLSVNLSYRGDELSNSLSYPHNGEQRGTPTEKDWIYMDMEVPAQLVMK